MAAKTMTKLCGFVGSVELGLGASAISTKF